MADACCLYLLRLSHIIWSVVRATRGLDDRVMTVWRGKPVEDSMGLAGPVSREKTGTNAFSFFGIFCFVYSHQLRLNA